jgi:putative glutamine amidotransferase
MSVAFGVQHPESARSQPHEYRMRGWNSEIIDPACLPTVDVHLTPGGVCHLLGCETIRVNSLHGQGILEPGERVVIEGIAEDGTIEAIRIADAPGFALGVQWHAEYDPQHNPINRALFEAFGEALKAHRRAA